VRIDDVAFEDTPVYRNAKPRISAIVDLKRQNPQSFGANLATLLERKQTFEEALNGTAFNTVERQRLAMIQREVFEQLALVVDDAIDVKAADQFIEMLLTDDEDVVIDSGAASFLPLSSHLIDTEIAGLLDAAGRELVIHTIVTGGGSFRIPHEDWRLLSRIFRQPQR
jgi:hypothetical protein